MSHLKKSHPHKNAKSNPFDSDDELDTKQTLNPSRRTSSEPPPTRNTKISTNPFDDDEVKGTSSSAYSLSYAERNKYKHGFHDSGGLENQSVQELENYAAYKAEETTKAVNGCLKIAVDIREDATKTLVTLHHQGDQITRTHMVAADIDQDLSRGEKLMGSLGGLFSRTWKPKKTRPITGPVIMRDDPVHRKVNQIEQREKLGLTTTRNGQSTTRTPPPEPTNVMQKVEYEKYKQDDALSEISNILGDLKEMAIDIGSEIDRQNKALDPFHDDADELISRVKQVNVQGRKLLRK